MKQKNTVSQRMQYTYPVLSRIGPWMRDKQRIAEVTHFANMLNTKF